jgi:starvation-inducible DNA-binding protein
VPAIVAIENLYWRIARRGRMMNPSQRIAFIVTQPQGIEMKKTKTTTSINIGINDSDRADIAKGLSLVLADTYSLYLKTHNFHWNVTGPMFNTLHTMFMEQYTELWNSVDPIAERIRALGFPAPGSYGQFSKLSSVSDAPATPPKALDMVADLVNGHETVARTARKILKIAGNADDQPTADLLTQRLVVHEKTAWMLRSLLADGPH